MQLLKIFCITFLFLVNVYAQVWEVQWGDSCGWTICNCNLADASCNNVCGNPNNGSSSTTEGASTTAISITSGASSILITSGSQITTEVVVTTDSEGNSVQRSSPKEENGSKVVIAVGASLGVIVLLLIAVVAFFLVRRKLKQERDIELPDVKTNSKPSFQETRRANTSEDPLSKLQKLQDVEIKHQLGSGNFGTVFYAEWHASPVAAKQLKGEEEWIAFGKEADILDKMKHPNVIQYLGVYTSSEGNKYIITDFMNKGSLKDFLGSATLTNEQKMDLACQACKAMVHLEKANCIHRDIAARNFLVSQVGDGLTVKLGDFGMARELISDQYSAKVSVPVRWSAPEVLKTGTYSIKSDAWSFGVLIWEIFNNAEIPYGWLDNKGVYDYVTRGQTIPPNNIPNAVYNEVKKCLNLDPNSRPSFVDIYTTLNTIELYETTIVPEEYSTMKSDPMYITTPVYHSEPGEINPQS